MNTMKRIKTKYDSVNKAMGIGRGKRSKAEIAFSKVVPAAVGPAPTAPVSKAAKDWHSTARKALEILERANHDATTPQERRASKKAMDVAQKAFDKVFQAHEKGARR